MHVGSLSLYNPRYASAILAEEANRVVTAMMPFNVGVWETAEGQVFISRMNIEMVGLLFGGTVAEVLTEAGEDIGDAISMVAVDG